MGRRKHSVPCDPPKPRGRPRKTAEHTRERKATWQRNWRQGKKLADEDMALNCERGRLIASYFVETEFGDEPRNRNSAEVPKADDPVRNRGSPNVAKE